jgi:hypothetical protein
MVNASTTAPSTLSIEANRFGEDDKLKQQLVHLPDGEA